MQLLHYYRVFSLMPFLTPQVERFISDNCHRSQFAINILALFPLVGLSAIMVPLLRQNPVMNYIIWGELAYSMKGWEMAAWAELSNIPVFTEGPHGKWLRR